MRCLRCKYDLSSLTEHRCPECGHGFNPDDPRTYLSEAWFEHQTKGLMRWAFRTALFPICAIIAVSGVFVIGDLFTHGSARHTVFYEIMESLFLMLVVAILFSILVVLLYVSYAMGKCWRGGWAMRRIILSKFATIIGIWIASLFVSGCLVRFLAS